MHPRNRYARRPPNFAQLADKCAKLRPYVSYPDDSEAKEAEGHARSQHRPRRAFIDFRDTNAIRALTEATLECDFNLLTDIPDGHLIPTVPQKLNYLHWLEDLLRTLVAPPDKVRVVDIGTGPIAIYCVLGARLHPEWQFVGTELDPKACRHAQETIARNQLTESVHIVSLPHARREQQCNEAGSMSDPGKAAVEQAAHIFGPALSTTTDPVELEFAISMCNPPFYDTHESPANYTGIRPAPKVEATGSSSEMHVQGGEVAFVTRMMEESARLRTRVGWYTVMLGKKRSLLDLRPQLTALGCTHVVESSFVQGKTHRWAVAWTFLPRAAFKNDHKTEREFTGRQLLEADKARDLASGVSTASHERRSATRIDVPTSGVSGKRGALGADATTGEPASKRAASATRPRAPASEGAWRTASKFDKLPNVCRPAYGSVVGDDARVLAAVRAVLTAARPVVIHEQSKKRFETCIAAFKVFLGAPSWPAALQASGGDVVPGQDCAEVPNRATALAGYVLNLYRPRTEGSADDKAEQRVRVRLECKGSWYRLTRCCLACDAWLSVSLSLSLSLFLSLSRSTNSLSLSLSLCCYMW
ncbi:uncharacterized protein MONBRDRAFT_27301 [Monosiga brevicollis MX1]|uniref:U6 small nuclear RNA (adenine-(43)-N(6))-methyltransferase n=1 Tax=Monosiga brevicollis TaxID=81824 RepID=A9V4W7_MONBE|nr:uncharacterized protein MONBRDRAFT_27301 [Monosiga brevicollis MX1]EDQ87441.1 predicted protein [Monosiga brevicollis MX1]|eukprot:XP_001747701.1 hypothetical protein [Monosiga brevicollis MX1]